ncbi:MAG TPA: VOC family protein [Acidimicrobiales bacterium]|nr:VOC family protein [Acidimicrobiales bacterium]
MIRPPAHIGIATRSIEEALAALGSRPKPIAELDLVLRTPAGLARWDLRRAYARAGSLIIELLSGAPETSWHTTAVFDFHHYAYWSEDLGEETLRLVADGWHVEATLAAEGGRPSGFAYLARADSPRVELIARELAPARR